MSQKIVRTVCFSHSEPYLEYEGKRYQLAVRVFEFFGQEKPFESEIQLWNQTDEKFDRRSFRFSILGDALEHVNKVFDSLSFNGIPEVLYLPEWSEEGEAQKNIDKWSENIFGLGNSNLQKAE